MYLDLIPKIKTVLDTLTGTGQKISTVYDYPTSEIKGYPAVIFKPAPFENIWLTNMENRIGYQFKIWVIQEANVKDLQKAQNIILAGAVDDVIAAFDASWDQGANADGHLYWWQLTTGEWMTAVEKDGQEIYVEMDLIINTINNN